jgi:predicted small lipoprotein YifL
MNVAARLALMALLAAMVAGAGCASSGPRETPPAQTASPPSAATLADRQQIEVMREVLGGQARVLDAEQSEATPDCSRIRLLARNICTLAEHICAIAARYPAGDPIADTCSDARARCRRASEIVRQRCTLPAE